MIIFPIYYLLIGYLIFILIFAFFAFFNIYHMFKFGFLSLESFFMTFLFLAGVSVILFITYYNAQAIDWQATIEISLRPF